MAQKREHPNPNVRQLGEDYPINTEESDVNPLMYAGVGGSTILRSAHWQRFMPSNFRVRSLDGVADDWPFTYEDLEPYYDQAEVEMGVSGLAGDPAFPPMTPSPMPSLPIGKVDIKAAEGMNKLGWHWWPGPSGAACPQAASLACGSPMAVRPWRRPGAPICTAPQGLRPLFRMGNRRRRPAGREQSGGAGRGADR
ncbi:MAG: hypothetical protein AAFY02_21175 [Pseudomonadota bacterium]